MATFYGIGVGPGDSQLVTIKASQRLKELTILYTPEAKKGGKSLALQIAEPYLSEQLVIKQRHFPMTTSLREKTEQWQAIASEIVADVQAGEDVGFITLGDPMIYSTYSYLLHLVEHEIETETISGIPSFLAMAAELGQPLTMDEESLVVVPATAPYEQLENALKWHDTIVLMKVANHLDLILPLLKKYDLLAKTSLVSHVSSDKQLVLSSLEGLTCQDKLSYFTTMIVKKSKR